MSCQYLSDGTRVCCYDRETTDRTQGVWTSCDECGHDWWCVVTERDWMGEPESWGCSGGCDDGWPYDPDDDYADVMPSDLGTVPHDSPS